MVEEGNDVQAEQYVELSLKQCMPMPMALESPWPFLILEDRANALLVVLLGVRKMATSTGRVQ